MVAEKLSGKEVSDDIKAKLTKDVAEVKRNNPDFAPGLVIVQVGGREDSNVYIRMKMLAAEKIGIKATHDRLPRYLEYFGDKGK